MKIGKTAKPKSRIAGSRFQRAKEIFGPWSSLLDDPRWGRIVFVKNEKSLRQWTKTGVPNGRIPDLARYFRVDARHFTDPCIDALSFDRLIYTALDIRERRNRPAKEKFGSQQHLGIVGVSAIRSAAHDWFADGCPYRVIESITNRIDIDFEKTELFENENDHRVLAFLAVCAFHYGKNWKYWFERIQQDAMATEILFDAMKELTYVRPRLRMLYAFQYLPKERIREFVNICKGSELSEILDNQVVAGKMTEFICSYEKTMPGKVGTVLRELVAYWGEEIPGVGLFGPKPPSLK